MQTAIISSAVIAAILLGATLLVVWTRGKHPIIRASALPMAIAGALVSAFCVVATLGQAVPLIGGVTAPAGEAPVLSAKVVKGDGIYVTLDLGAAPRLYWMPWNRKTAEALQEMFDDPNNAGVVATIPPFEFTWDIHPPSFQPLPQPKWMPDKPPESAGPLPKHFSA